LFFILSKKSPFLVYFKGNLDTKKLGKNQNKNKQYKNK